MQQSLKLDQFSSFKDLKMLLQRTMQGFTEMIVNLMKSQHLFESQDFPLYPLRLFGNLQSFVTIVKVHYTGYLNANEVSSPFASGIQLDKPDPDAEDYPHPEIYRKVIGKLLYLGFTRPDIAFITQQLSQFMQKPAKIHWDAAVHVLRLLCNAWVKPYFMEIQEAVYS
ncbi:uncharacterized protein [Euphorbia lathyris]|uniref:uncharacterized protein isoform X2 n=1 Tax=Euphorbia lathyris TaxID=212925 RepID=UPI0033143FEE